MDRRSSSKQRTISSRSTSLRLGAVTQRACSMDPVVLEDEKAVWLDLLDEATGALNKELKGVNFLRTEIPSHLRESCCPLRAPTTRAASPMAIPDTLRRLTVGRTRSSRPDLSADANLRRSRTAWSQRHQRLGTA